MLVKMIEQFYDKPFFTDLLYPQRFEDGAYLLMDGAVGNMWEIEGINIDGKSPDEIQKASTSFANFIKSLPQDVPMQIITATWRGWEKDDLSIFSQGDLSNEHIREYMQRKVEWHNHGKLNGFAREGNIQFCPRTIKTFLTIKQKPPDEIQNGKMHDDKTMKEMKGKLTRAEMLVDTSLSSGGLKHRRVMPDDLIAYMYRMLNPDRFLSTMPVSYRNGEDLRSYMVFNSPYADQNGWTFESKRYSVISFANNPAEADDAGELHTYPNILFREVNGVSLYDYMPMMLFAINFVLPSQDTLSRELNAKRTLSWMHRLNIFGAEAIDKVIAQEETKRLLQLMYSGEKVVLASYHLCIPSTEEAAEYDSAQLVSHLNITTGSNAFKEDLIAPGIFLRCLPFGFDHTQPHEKSQVKRARIATASVIADIAPIYMSGRGRKTNTAAGSYNRRGQSAFLDLRDKKTATTSPHFLIIGQTGSGKSFLAVDLIHQLIRKPATVIALEKGDSFKKLCQLSGGQHLKFEGTPDFILDPFNGDFQEDHRGFLTAVISTMITGGSEQISREEVSAISEAVLQLVTHDPETRNMRQLVETLKSYSDAVSQSAGRKLFPFYDMGQYARFVEGDKPRLKLSNQLDSWGARRYRHVQGSSVGHRLSAHILYNPVCEKSARREISIH